MNKRGLLACECIDRTNRHAKQRSHEFGQRTQALVQALLPSEDRLKAFRAQLQERGFLSAEGYVRWKQFIPTHLAFHSEPFADARLTLVSRDADLIQMSVANWMSGRRCLHPVIYLLVEWSLSEISSPPVAKPNVVVRRDAPARAAVMDAIAQTNSLSSAATSLGVATTTLITRAAELGLELHLKPSKLKLGLRTAIEKSFVHGVSVEAVAAEFDVSIPSVYRILRATGQLKSERARLDGVRDERDRCRWLGIVYSSPDCSLTQLRKKAPALYARLYRNKQETLAAQPHECEKHKIHAGGGHRSYLQSHALLSIRASVSTTRVAPRLRLSTRRISFLTGLSPYSLLRASAEIRGELNKARETKSRFVERRIEEACGEMGVPVLGHQRWRVLRYLGMRLSATRLNLTERKCVKKEGR
ncbi:TnsD family Tn7-like transposition protein [Paraburkholderia sp. 40]|uniref:TnsD family Tn7-like transposition protein n=1 Tax=Paraburkholderia sp. 40 TaxID=2991059 RepID=UPI003D25D3EB